MSINSCTYRACKRISRYRNRYYISFISITCKCETLNFICQLKRKVFNTSANTTLCPESASCYVRSTGLTADISLCLRNSTNPELGNTSYFTINSNCDFTTRATYLPLPTRTKEPLPPVIEACTLSSPPPLAAMLTGLSTPI